MNQENQLLSAKMYLQQSEFIEKGFKIVVYIENDFVRALGFITPLWEEIGINNVTEIVIDSTFKTNQERFELFAVNANCGGYGMPIAYLYLCTYDGTEELRHVPRNASWNTREFLCWSPTRRTNASFCSIRQRFRRDISSK